MMRIMANHMFLKQNQFSSSIQSLLQLAENNVLFEFNKIQHRMNDWAWAWCFVIAMLAPTILCCGFSPIIHCIVWLVVALCLFISKLIMQLGAMCRKLVFRICSCCSRSGTMMNNNAHAPTRCWTVSFPRVIFEFSPRLYIINLRAETSSSTSVVSSSCLGDKSSESDVIVPVDLLR